VPGSTATLGIGLVAGLLNGSMAIVGPPVILFYFSAPIGTAVGRASIVTFFLGTDSFGTAMFAAQGLITAEILWRRAVFIPDRADRCFDRCPPLSRHQARDLPKGGPCFVDGPQRGAALRTLSPDRWFVGFEAGCQRAVFT
jgi:hypothetical protein